MARRAGFTLVELLVVIAIIGMLIALLLPGVQMAREAGRRSQCSNHLKQLALAFHSHQTALRLLPSAGGPDWSYHMTYVNGRPAVTPRQHGGWGFQILPYIEAEAVWMGSGGTTDEEKSIIAISTPNPLFFCPSRRDPEVVVAKEWEYRPKTGKTYGHAKNDYAASTLDSTFYKPDGTTAQFSDGRGIGAVTRTFSQYTDEPNYSPLSIDLIRDGTTNTMLLGEKRLNVGCLGQLQGHDNEGYTAGWNHDTSRYTNNEPRPDFVDANCGNLDGDRFGSSHPGGLNIALCDGSVRFIPYSISLDTFKRLGCRIDGETVQLAD